MYKKKILQLFLVLTLFFSIFLFYQKYFKNNIQTVEAEKKENKIVDLEQKNTQGKKKINTTKNLEANEDKVLSEKSNILKDIKYISKDEDGNIYEISAEKGMLNLNDPNITSMDGVVAKVILSDKSTINIQSNHAIYNRKNYNTNFSGKVQIKHLAHHISCEKMDILFSKNLATLYDNLIYKNKKTRLKADKMEVDLITKNSKIFMYNNNKISVVSNN
tara:strand:+ start:502 stop:1155 length:654 start_codon:yes stop_codon:yes gene_type:complete